MIEGVYSRRRYLEKQGKPENVKKLVKEFKRKYREETEEVQ